MVTTRVDAVPGEVVPGEFVPGEQVLGIRRNSLTNYFRRYLNDLSGADISTHSVSFSTSVRDAGFLTYVRRYLNDVT